MAVFVAGPRQQHMASEGQSDAWVQADSLAVTSGRFGWRERE